MSKPAKYFDIHELVDPDTLAELNQDAWTLLDQKAVDTIDWIREKTGKLMTVNNYEWGGRFKYRGYRPENCTVGAPKSAHKKGMAFDFDVKGMSSQAVRMWLIEHENELPHPIRCEADVTWVHIDTNVRTKDKLYFFKP